MPIYDYQCSRCGHKAEVMRKISAASTEACPACSAEAFSKQLSAPSFQLSGSGWYATDFKNSGNKAPASKGTASTGTESPSAEAKSEAATEKKPEAAASASCATGCACH